MQSAMSRPRPEHHNFGTQHPPSWLQKLYQLRQNNSRVRIVGMQFSFGAKYFFITLWRYLCRHNPLTDILYESKYSVGRLRGGIDQIKIS